jgi:hypothetical protein
MCFLNITADIISIIGLALLGYGLFLFDPRVSYCTVGVLLIAAGYRIGSAGNRPAAQVTNGLDV